MQGRSEIQPLIEDACELVYKARCEECGTQLVYIYAENIWICPKCIDEGRE